LAPAAATLRDERIRESLSSEDRELLVQMDADDTLYHNVIATFQGRMRWMNILSSILGFALFGVALVCAWRFTLEAEPRGMLMWGAGAALAISGVTMIKVWFWMEIQKNSIVREIKRVELQVAKLAASMRPRQCRQAVVVGGDT
jgi:hypothetical protein